MAYILLISCVVTTVLTLIYYYITKHYNFWKKLKVPGPEPLFLFGNIKDTVLGRVFFPLDYRSIYDEYRNEKYVGLFNLRTPALLVKDLDILKHIYIKDFDKFTDRGFDIGSKGLGQNLFHADGETWSILRKKFSPLFTSGKLNNMFPLMKDRAEAFIQYLETKIDQGNIPEIGSLTEKYTSEVIGACAFGVNVNGLNDNKNMYIEAASKAFEPSLNRIIDLMNPGLFKKYKLCFFPKRLVNFFYSLTKEILNEREGKTKTRHDFMDLLLEMREQGKVAGSKIKSDEKIDLEITEAIIASQAFVFFIAGYDTSATTMTFMLYEMALNQDIQEKVREEIDEVLANNNGKITYESLGEFNYLAMVMSETLRKYPVVDPLNRKALEDYHIPGTDLTIPKDTMIVASVSGIHYDPKYWDNPEKFTPDRFLPENVNRRHPLAWLAFGDGPRHCIGMRFAKVQATLGIVSILSKFRVEPNDKTITGKSVTFNPAKLTPQINGGCWLNIKRR